MGQMVIKLKSWLNTSYLFHTDLKKDIRMILITIIIVSIFVQNGFISFSLFDILMLSTSVFITSILNIFICKKYFGIVDWKIKNELVYSTIYISSIATIIFFTLVLIRNLEMTFIMWLRFESYSIFISIMPMALKFYRKQIWVLKNQLNKSTHNEHSSNKIIIQSDIKSEFLNVNPNDILFIKSDQNYVIITYINNLKIDEILLRMPLSQLFKQLNGESFSLCHRSYVINLKKVIRIEYNASKIVAIIDHYKIPISRRLKKDILEKLTKNKA